MPILVVNSVSIRPPWPPDVTYEGDKRVGPFPDAVTMAFAAEGLDTEDDLDVSVTDADGRSVRAIILETGMVRRRSRGPWRAEGGRCGPTGRSSCPRRIRRWRVHPSRCHGSEFKQGRRLLPHFLGYGRGDIGIGPLHPCGRCRLPAGLVQGGRDA
jgi:hypothetical protein